MLIKSHLYNIENLDTKYIDNKINYNTTCIKLKQIAHGIMLFFGATGGMIGVASLAGKKWAVITTISFLIMAVLAFVQRQVTGM